jgi:hypothetical protein
MSQFVKVARSRARALFLSRKRPFLVGTFPGKKSQHSSLHCGFARSTNGSVGAAELVCSALAFPHPLVPLVISRRRRFRRHQSRWRVHPPGCASAPIPARSGAPQQHPLTHLYPDASRRSLALQPTRRRDRSCPSIAVRSLLRCGVTRRFVLPPIRERGTRCRRKLVCPMVSGIKKPFDSRRQAFVEEPLI